MTRRTDGGSMLNVCGGGSVARLTAGGNVVASRGGGKRTTRRLSPTATKRCNSVAKETRDWRITENKRGYPAVISTIEGEPIATETALIPALAKLNTASAVVTAAVIGELRAAKTL